MQTGGPKLATSILCGCVLGLLAFGIVMVYSVSPVHDSTRFVSRQLVACGLGLAGAGLFALTDYRGLRRWAWWFFGAALVLLVLVLIPGIGFKTNGARRWFRVWGFQFQPSDLAKLALLIALAHYGAQQQRFMRTFRYGVLLPGVFLGAPLILLFLEPDWGTGLLLAATGGVVLLVAGVRFRFLVLPLLAGLMLVGGLLAIDPVRSKRLHSWLHLEETKLGTGYQAYRARIALGNGGLAGVGLNQSVLKPSVPEHRTDFLFAIVGEEFGFAGSVGVIVAFAALFAAGLTIAWQAPDRFGLLLGTGLSFLIGLQALINIGVVSGALPNKGLALPFLSYGGSNLMIMLWCTGLLLSIARGAAEQAATQAAALPVPATSAIQLA